eukprot:CAMPEP_0197424582 /NCGR_PEP_ID=MMETSP1170-20131217/26887_1 /TAXON_ID=54406 /ORGANISM="Sarcinochrysis sp, Strain CCMP770" /LENGTH=196 /DNA_ID=CAMNT_0042952071 /DNA_START=73 /DNA_END=663 /DNA_ORIENTATION=+
MPGVSIRNESDVPLMGVLSQLTPLHWTGDAVAPGETVKISSGRVWFTLDVNGYDKNELPTAAGTAARLTAIVASTIFVPLPLPLTLAITGGVSRVTSNYSTTNKTLAVRGDRLDGVYADNRVAVVKGFARPDGIYVLYVDRYEWLDDATGEVRELKNLPKPRLHPLCVRAYPPASGAVVATTVPTADVELKKPSSA